MLTIISVIVVITERTSKGNIKGMLMKYIFLLLIIMSFILFLAVTPGRRFAWWYMVFDNKSTEVDLVHTTIKNRLNKIKVFVIRAVKSINHD